MMRRFETIMATATTKIRLACMRASSECSSMPSPFRAASPQPALRCFYPFRDLSAAGTWIFLEVCTFGFCMLVFLVLRLSRTLGKQRLKSLGKWVFDTEVMSSRISIHNRCNSITVNRKNQFLYVAIILICFCV